MTSPQMIGRPEISVVIDGGSSQAQQRDECVLVQMNGTERKYWLHDYEEIYRIPGLYESIFVDLFQGISHRIVPKKLKEVLDEDRVAPAILRCIDFGSGVGLAVEELVEIGLSSPLGIDISPAAKAAALRDRGALYHDYLVADMTSPDAATLAAITTFEANCLICVSSLNVIPSVAFATLFNSLPIGAYMALNVLSGALDENPATGDLNGSNALIRHLLVSGAAQLRSNQRYAHRMNSANTPIFYNAVVATKVKDVETEVAKHLECHTWK